MKNAVQLITYTERFGGADFEQLHATLTAAGDGVLKGAFGAVHLLPFYDSINGVDAGFDPKDHMAVDPALGGWANVAQLSDEMDVMADVIVNHISNQSPQYLDFDRMGAASCYAGLFLTQNKVFPTGLSDTDKHLIYRPRPIPAFSDVTLACGERHTLWTTFNPEQIDIDVRAPQGQVYLQNILETLAKSGVRIVRLDAVGYAIKKAGTSCFMLPETFDFIAYLTRRAKDLGIEVLVEVHSHYQTQVDIAQHVDWVYDFALPPLILHALHTGQSGALKNWLHIRPTNAVTVLDTHDGIGIIDIGADKKSGRVGLISNAELDALVEAIHSASNGQSRLATGSAASNLDLYQVNCTYYSALGCDDQKYLIARALQFFSPGVPQVYYVGLLAGANDMALLEKTKVGRDINRRYYSAQEVDEELKRPVVQRLLAMIRLRNTHPAFDLSQGAAFSILPSNDHGLALQWTSGKEHTHRISLAVDFPSSTAQLLYTVVDPQTGMMNEMDFFSDRPF